MVGEDYYAGRSEGTEHAQVEVETIYINNESNNHVQFGGNQE